MEYEVMNKEELTDYIFSFWNEWGVFDCNDLMKNEISINLTTKDGIERELDCVRDEFASGWSEDSREYEELGKLWNYLNWYKTDFYNKEVK